MTNIIIWMAISFSVILAIQIILSFIGGDSDTDTDIDTDIDTDSESDSRLRIFTFKNFVAFFTMFSWSWLSFHVNLEMPILISTLLSATVGTGFVVIFIWVLKLVNKLSDDGKKINIKNTIGQTVDVYLTIPANKKGTGEITINLNGRRQLKAMTEETTQILTGQSVIIDKVVGDIIFVKLIII